MLFKNCYDRLDFLRGKKRRDDDSFNQRLPTNLLDKKAPAFCRALGNHSDFVLVLILNGFEQMRPKNKVAVLSFSIERIFGGRATIHITHPSYLKGTV